ncbi:metal-sensing transcriptional repressor [Pseudolactococcus piscium]|nr:metal-sensing transcriptional repressor [Lactococcus piscium]
MSKKKVKRDAALVSDLTRRTNRIEGQIRGITRMVNEDVYCDDILHQIIAAKAALNAVSKLLLKNHMQTCLVDGIKDNNEAIIDEVLATIGKMIK